MGKPEVRAWNPSSKRWPIGNACEDRPDGRRKEAE